MSFRWPELLWAVLLVPLVLLVWMRGERRRTQRAGVFGNPALLPNVVTARPGWRRVLPVILYLLAATVLLLALARPEATAQVPRDQATIMLVMDYSESMLNTDVTPTRIEAAQEAADAFLEEIPKRFQVGLVTFAGAPSVEALPTTDKDVIRSALRNAALRRGTAVGDALVRALQASRPRN
ncbi:MAG TPA: VWA domain-containing protein, partial [Actinomycetota bacterium]|nr:VWA domain-containing protein [Actinomycetota bacterium]